MHSSLTVADYLLDRASNHKNDSGAAEPIALKPLQVIKLVYLCHGWLLGLYGRPLLVENVEAWRYGPVLAVLYQAVKKFRRNQVNGPLTADNGVFDAQEKHVMDQVFDVYGRYTGKELSAMTHAPGTPWSQMPESNMCTIPNAIIKKHFEELARQ